jgi:hypothetical protein
MRPFPNRTAEEGKADGAEEDKAEAAREEAAGEGETEGAPTTDPFDQKPFSKNRFDPLLSF